MYQMHAIEGSGLHKVLKTEVRSRQNSLEFHERLFLCEYGKMLLHKQLQHEGLLSPHASPVYLRTDISTENGRQKTQKIKVDKGKIASSLKTPEENVTLKEERE